MTKVHFNYVYDSSLIIHHWSANRNHLNTTFIWFRSVSWSKQQQPKATWRGLPWSWEGRTRASCLLTVTVSQGWSFWGRRSWLRLSLLTMHGKKTLSRADSSFFWRCSLLQLHCDKDWPSLVRVRTGCCRAMPARVDVLFHFLHFSFFTFSSTFPGTDSLPSFFSFTFLIALTSLHVAKKPLLCELLFLASSFILNSSKNHLNCCTLLISVWTRNGIWDVSLPYSEP